MEEEFSYLTISAKLSQKSYIYHLSAIASGTRVRFSSLVIVLDADGKNDIEMLSLMLMLEVINVHFFITCYRWLCSLSEQPEIQEQFHLDDAS